MTAANEGANRAATLAAPDKRWLWLISVATPFLPGFAALLLMNGAHPGVALLPLAYYFGLVVFLDLLIGEDPFNPTEETIDRLAGDPYYRVILYLAVAVQYASVILAAMAAASLALPVWAFLALAAGAGVASGAGLAIGHELGHKANRLDRAGAFLANNLSAYAHFRIEHNRGHHADVATPEDSASARLGESVWRFAGREIPGALARGWAFEAERLKRKGAGVFSLRNEIIGGWLFALVFAGALVLLFGPLVLAFLLVHHVVAWLQLTFANYVEHYALLRERLPTGRYEPCAPKHSWNSNHIVTNLSLFHLERHSDHHANPMRPYQALRHFPEAPRLPTGYAGCFLMAAVPPLWFRAMDKRALDWAGGDIARLNVDPRRAH
jgi:alkane 1-monooxygenase